MRIIDLTHPIQAEMPVYPGDKQPIITTMATLSKDGFQTQRLTISTHTGTHIDAPAHLLPATKTLDQFPASHFQGLVQVIDCRDVPGEISCRHLKAQLALPMAEFILLMTGWDRHWGTEAYFSGPQVLSAEAADWLAKLPIKGIGVDAASIDEANATELPNHRRFLSQGILIIENLTRLDALCGQVCHLYCLPLLITGADGAPARVIATLGE